MCRPRRIRSGMGHTHTPRLPLANTAHTSVNKMKYYLGKIPVKKAVSLFNPRKPVSISLTQRPVGVKSDLSHTSFLLQGSHCYCGEGVGNQTWTFH